MITEEQITDFWNEHALDYRLGKISEFGLMERAAKHFYELALKDLRAGQPEWKWPDGKHEYPPCLTREMDVNGDWHYSLSSGRIYEGCQYLSLAEIELRSKNAGPYPNYEY